MTTVTVTHVLDHIKQHLKAALEACDDSDYDEAEDRHIVATALFDLLDHRLNDTELERWKELDARYRALDADLTAQQEREDEINDTERINEDEQLVQQYLRVAYQQNNMAGVSLQWSDDEELWSIEPKGIMAGRNLDEVEQFLTSELARFEAEKQ